LDDLALNQIIVFLGAAGLIIPLVKRMRVSPVLGFLVVGILVGPYGITRDLDTDSWLRQLTVTDVAGVKALAELGIVFLLFTVGLELSLARLWQLRQQVFGLGGMQIVVTSLVIGAIAWAFGNTLEAAFVLGACLALSSTAIVIQLLSESGRFSTPVGQGSFAILLSQDLAVVPLLFIVAALASEATTSVPIALGLALMQAAAAILLILGLGKVCIQPLLRFVRIGNSPELFLAATLLVIIATASLTHAAGLSAALGAFLVGLLFAETEFRFDIEVDIEPFKGLLLGLFFMSIGMSIDLAEVARTPGWIALSVVGLLAIKCAITFVCARLFRYSTMQALELGLLLGHGGEFAFVAIALATSLALLPAPTAQFMLIVVSATMMLTPIVAHAARALTEHLDRGEAGVNANAAALPEVLKGHVIVVGYGRTGQLLCDVLSEQHFAVVALDRNPARVVEAFGAGHRVFVGDASRRSLLEKFSPEKAVAVAVSTDDTKAAERVLLAVRSLAPETPVLVRARDTQHAQTLARQGASGVVPEVQEAGLQIAALLLQHAGLSIDASSRLIETRRTRLMREMTDESES
jgi:monovalent cation:H+ antiporter-2, CPA2 family